jgi:plastocyanin
MASRTHLPPRCRRIAERATAFGVVVAVGLVLSACSSGSVPSASASQRPLSHETVTIKNFAFSPSDFTVVPGAKITIDNHDSVTHTFTADDGSFTTGDIAPGRAKTITAPKKKGKYPYMCLIHQFMTGTLTVR